MKPIRDIALVMALALVWTPHHVVAADEGGVTIIDMEPGQVMLEFVGQVTDLPSDPPASNQSGYLSFIKGVEPIFIPDNPPFDRAKAKFGFFTQATATREISHDRLLIIAREGTTTISFTPCPLCLSPSADFANINSPLPTLLIQTSKVRQQVIIDSEARTFTVVSVNTITETRPFELGDTEYQLGEVGQIFRTSLVGRLDPVRLTAGHFAGYAVGVANLCAVGFSGGVHSSKSPLSERH